MTQPSAELRVTGASSGIGQALAVALAHTGARVWAVARSRDRLEALAEQAQRGPEPLFRSSPISSEMKTSASATREIMSRSEDVDVLVHSAGAIAFGTFESVSRGFRSSVPREPAGSRGADANASSRVETRAARWCSSTRVRGQSILDQCVVRRDETWSEGSGRRFLRRGELRRRGG